MDDVFRPFPRRRGERPARESRMVPDLYNSSTFASSPLTRDLRASSSEFEAISLEAWFEVEEDLAVSVEFDVGSLFSFLGFLFGVLTSVADASSTPGFVVAVAFFVDGGDAFAAVSFGSRTPPAEPALACSV